ncbi:GNAT family N-acetyltransferase [Desulfogranum japonicum]|uniref:GNAT family N-acetyltransferase n=1 Tax=Desulfogranum japonicum TaxID=231447 RepID=UPI000A001DFE
MGFHVHPSNRKLGIATTLSNDALKDAQSKGSSLFYIMTNKDNYPAIAIARKLGFDPVGNKFAKNNITIFKKQL